jgi:hypothetical protein
MEQVAVAMFNYISDLKSFSIDPTQTVIVEADGTPICGITR